MTATEKTPYEVKMQNWVIEKHSDCKNFQRIKEWSIANGYKLHSDVSYNGFLDVRKNICETEDPHDGHSLRLQIFCDESIADKNKSKHHGLDQYDMEIDFENDSIFKPTKYRYKMAHGIGTNHSTKDLEELLAFTLEREAILTAEHEQYLKENPTTEWEPIDADRIQYVRLVRGVPEFKEIDQLKIKGLLEKIKQAPKEKADAYIKNEFNNEFMWFQRKVLLSPSQEQEVKNVVDTYLKFIHIHEQTDKNKILVAKSIFDTMNLPD